MKKYIAIMSFALILSACEKKEILNTSESIDGAEKVKVGSVELTKDVSEFNYTGTIEAFKVTPVSFSSVGIVEDVYSEEGDYISKGKVMARLEKITAQNAYNASKAKLKQAQDAYDRLKKVYDAGSLPEIKWVEMESTLEQAKSMEAISANNLSKTELKAPVSGYIGARRIEPGMNSIGLGAAFEIMDISKVYITIGCPENEISKIKKGQKAAVSVSALHNAKYEGIVDNIGISASPMSRTYKVKILVHNKGNDLKPGMVCDVDLFTDEGEQQLTIPVASVMVDKDDTKYVYVANGETAKKQVIEVGNYVNERIVVKSGLKEGMKVITDGKNSVKDNEKIAY